MGFLGRGHGAFGLPKSKSTAIIVIFILTIIAALGIILYSEWIYGIATLGIGLSIIAFIYKK